VRAEERLSGGIMLASSRRTRLWMTALVNFCSEIGSGEP
jgi:hypothetical protein